MTNGEHMSIHRLWSTYLHASLCVLHQAFAFMQVDKNFLFDDGVYTCMNEADNIIDSVCCCAKYWSVISFPSFLAHIGLPSFMNLACVTSRGHKSIHHLLGAFLHHASL